MKELLLNQTTASQIEYYVKQPSHGLLIYGQKASGKKTLARRISAVLLGVEPLSLSKNPNFIEISRHDDKQTINVEDVRNLRVKLKLVTTGRGWPRRVVLIGNSELMGREPQNMLLKLLEEPPSDTSFILTTNNPSQLLPTVRSRLQKIAVMPVSENQASEHYSSKFGKSEIVSAWNLSSGSAGLMNSLLVNDSSTPLKDSVVLAKSLINMPLFERLKLVDQYSKDSEAITNLLDALTKVLNAAHNSSLKNGSPSSGILLKKRRLIINFHNQWNNGANAKLLLSNLMLSL